MKKWTLAITAASLIGALAAATANKSFDTKLSDDEKDRARPQPPHLWTPSR
jgi:hypothetical protein